MSLKLLANENIPGRSIALLEKAGFDVLAVAGVLRGASDQVVLEKARDDGRVLVTFDRDYGEMIFHRQMAAPPGVLFLRFLPESPQQVAELIQQVLNQTQVVGYFVVTDGDSIRRRRLPN